MTIQVVPLSESDIPGAVDVIQRAFEDDPYFLWVFDQSKFNKERNKASLTTRCQWGINNALVYVAKDHQPDTNNTNNNNNDTSKSEAQHHQHHHPQILGISFWLPPQPQSQPQPQTWSTWTQTLLLTAHQILTNLRHLGRGGLNMHRYQIWKTKQAEAQAQLWTDPRGYYFANIVAVDPAAQGRGVGRELVRVVTERADREGRRCYLESSKRVPNVEIYGRLGFGVVKVMECWGEEDGGGGNGDGDGDGEGKGDRCMLYCMIRDPKVNGSE